MNRAVNVETYCQCKKVYGDHTLFPAQQASAMNLGNETNIGRIYGSTANAIIFGIRTGVLREPKFADSRFFISSNMTRDGSYYI